MPRKNARLGAQGLFLEGGWQEDEKYLEPIVAIVGAWSNMGQNSK